MCSLLLFSLQAHLCFCCNPFSHCNTAVSFLPTKGCRVYRKIGPYRITLADISEEVVRKSCEKVYRKTHTKKAELQTEVGLPRGQH